MQGFIEGIEEIGFEKVVEDCIEGALPVRILGGSRGDLCEA